MIPAVGRNHEGADYTGLFQPVKAAAGPVNRPHEVRKLQKTAPARTARGA
jgi:hypothetical protein